MNTDDETSTKKNYDKLNSDNLTVSIDKLDIKKFEKTDEDPKPRIVLTIRSEKSSAKTNNMKIVSTEEKLEEFSPRRSSRTRGKWEWVCDSDTSTSPKKYKSASEFDDTEVVSTKRSTSRRNKESDNVVANAIARKEKLYDLMTPRSTRRQKPKVNEDSVLNEKKTRRTVKPLTQGSSTNKIQVDESEMDVVDIVTDDDGESQSSGGKVKNMDELGLKEINTEDEDEAGDGEEAEDDEEAPINDDEIDDDSEVISKLLEADDTSSDEDYYCSDEASTGDQRRRVTRRRSSRRTAGHSFNENVEQSGRVKRKRIRSVSPEEVQSEVENEETSNPAGGEEGSEAACPDEETTIIATCFCESPSNVYAAPEDLVKPVFCQAVELVDGVKVGCCHVARKEENGEHSALVRAGPRSPYILACVLHTKQLVHHMCCPACGVYCTQGIFYQCSKGHLFHLECGVPYNDSKAKPGCPHCGVYSYRWQPVNKDCYKVQIEMKCSNKRIYLPEQREQCTPAYLGFSTLSPMQLDNTPVIPEDLLPSPPIDLKQICKTSDEGVECSTQMLYDAIVAGETVHQLVPKIVHCKDINETITSENGSTCMHAAASRGLVAIAYLLHRAGAQLDVTDSNMRTPLLHAVSALLDKPTMKIKEKSNEPVEKESTEETELDPNKDTEKVVEKEEKNEEKEVNDGKDNLNENKEDLNVEKEDLNENKEEANEEKEEIRDEDEAESSPNKDNDLIKMIRYLVAAGCDVNIADSDGMTALHVAAQHGSVDVSRIVLRSSTAVLDPRDNGGWTPLVWAAENNNADIVRYLLKEGSDALTIDNEGNGLIHWCVLAGSSACLPLLLDKEPDLVNAFNANGDTPLHVAARQGHFACVVVLLARGAKSDVENAAGELPLDVCTGQCHNAISLNMQMTMVVRDTAVKHKILCSDISNGREQFPIPCVNEFDNDDCPLPEDFTYVTRHVMPQQINVDNTIQTMQGCTCKDGDCSAGGCACSVLSVKTWISMGRLHHSFPFHDPPMIFECNETCACNAKKCTNRTISRLCKLGATFVRSEVFMSGEGRGWGLRSVRAVRRGAPVAMYCGELVPAPGADARLNDQYMFALDINQDLLERCSDNMQLCVDAAQYGSSARFINHSCRPNLVPVRVFTSIRDLRLPLITLFATRDIRPLEEFTFDYGDKFWSVKSKWMKCECGVPECRYPTKCEDSDA